MRWLGEEQEFFGVVGELLAPAGFVPSTPTYLLALTVLDKPGEVHRTA